MQIDVVNLTAELAAGGFGGLAAGAILRNFSLGRVWNILAGIVGGGFGAQALFNAGLITRGASDSEAFGAALAGGVIGGAFTLIVLGLAKSMVRH